MLSIIMKRLTIGVSAACLLASTSVVYAGNITIYAAANLQESDYWGTGLLLQLENDYQTYVDPTATFTNTFGATATLEANIIALGNSGTGQADIFLAANTGAPNDLYTNHNTLVTGSPFDYAQGYILLWSGNNNQVDVSGGLPLPSGTAPSQTFPAAFVIANPATAPYGNAAKQLMAGSPWSFTSPIPGGNVYTSTDIASTYNAVSAGTYGYGFIAKSQVCGYDGTDYSWSMNTYSKHIYDSGYSALVQAGIVINRTGQDTSLTSGFVSFLSSAQGLADIQAYCYSTPGYDLKKAVFLKPKHKLNLPEHFKQPLFPVNAFHLAHPEHKSAH